MTCSKAYIVGRKVIAVLKTLALLAFWADRAMADLLEAGADDLERMYGTD